jgi:beta-lactamase class D
LKNACFIAAFILGTTVLPAESIDSKNEVLVSAKAPDIDKPIRLEGNAELLRRQSSPASTIKVALALMGLQEGVLKPDSTYVCSDRHSKPTRLDLRQALELSSNEFFAHLAKDLGAQKIHQYCRLWGYPPILERREPPDYERIARGKVFSVSPLDQVFFLARIATQSLEGVSKPAYQMLDRALDQEDRPGLCGKTVGHGACRAIHSPQQRWQTAEANSCRNARTT